MKNKLIILFILLFFFILPSNTFAKDFTLVCNGEDDLLKNKWNAEYLISATKWADSNKNKVWLIKVVSETASGGRLSSFYPSEATVKTMYEQINLEKYSFEEFNGIIDIRARYSYKDSAGTVNTDYRYTFSLRSGILTIKGNLTGISYSIYANCTGHQQLFNFLNTKVVDKKIKQKPPNDFKQYWWVVVLIAVGSFFVYMLTTKDLKKVLKTKKTTTQNQGVIKKFFKGDVPLSTSFWGVYFGIGIIIGLIFFVIEKNEIAATLYSLFVLIPFVIFTTIGTWRSASKYKIEKQKKKEGTGWGTAAQVYIVLSIIRSVVELVKEFS